MQTRNRFSIFLTAFVFAAMNLPIFFASVAQAALGSNEETVRSEMRAEGVTPKVMHRGRYIMHESAEHKLKLHQFVGGSGKVFAVAWNGKTHPDFAVLMGSHFQEFKAALNEANKHRHGHSPIVIDYNGFHLELGGHAMAVSGRAWLTKEVPSGVSLDEIR